jgi:two-component system, NarL family, sensor histidine kinase UhpB
MARAPAGENDLILSALPARAGDSRLALGVVLLSLVLFLAAAPFAKLSLAPVPAFLPFYESALSINDAITALLLFGQAHATRSRALLVLACGYVFTALITLAHLLSFPAVFSPTGLLGAGPQSTAWLYMFWHGGFPLVVLVYAFLKGDARKPVVVNRNSILAGLLAAALAAAGFTLLATAGHDLLPALILQNRFTAAQRSVIAIECALPLIVAAVLWLRRPHSVLDLWLMVVMLAWVFDIGLSGLLNGARYDLGFYAGRVYGLLAASFVLMVLLFEQVVMYTRLLEARARERSNIEEIGVANADIAARRELLRRLAEVEEDERRAIHRELHDRIGQDLATAKLNIDLAKSNEPAESAAGVRLEAARDLVQSAIQNSRDIMAELRPPGLDDHGLAVALELYAEAVAKRLSIAVTVRGIELEQRLPRLAETSLFRIAQEAINNLAKHANARKVDISLYEEAQEVRLTISDDGSGFDATRLPEAGRYGFQIMRERAEAVDARLEVESAPGRGTRIIAIMERPS